MIKRDITIVILLLLLSFIGALVGYKYYRHTQEDPEFCASCHLMQEAFRTWQMSRHRDLQCQICHSMNLLEQNRLLVAFVVKGSRSVKQTHGRVKPWKSCKTCHLEEAAQGSITLQSSYGHARHVFMENINCSKCHTGDMHNFKPQEMACRECHKDKLVHGLGMEGLLCLNCHSFGEKSPKMVLVEKCLVCHKDIPSKGPMAHIKCFECHKPHEKIKLTSNDCLVRCHGNESQVGQHGLHMREAGLNCLDCHKAHIWIVGPKEAKGLCNRCHSLKDPKTFIY
jgi:nitrate/TMAO reductase-like tetraheme cytochrome c subunit